MACAPPAAAAAAGRPLAPVTVSVALSRIAASELRVLERAFAGWTAPQSPARLERPLWTPPAARLVFETPDKQNASLRMRQPLALTDRADDYPALLLGNYLLGQGGQSRLWLRVREREGLSYDVGSWIEWNPWEPGSWWQFRAIFAPDKLAAVETALREEMDRALREGFSAQEVAEGQAALLNLRRLSLMSHRLLLANVARQHQRIRSMTHNNMPVRKPKFPRNSLRCRQYARPAVNESQCHAASNCVLGLSVVWGTNFGGIGECGAVSPALLPACTIRLSGLLCGGICGDSSVVYLRKTPRLPASFFIYAHYRLVLCAVGVVPHGYCIMDLVCDQSDCVGELGVVIDHTHSTHALAKIVGNYDCRGITGEY